MGGQGEQNALIVLGFLISIIFLIFGQNGLISYFSIPADLVQTMINITAALFIITSALLFANKYSKIGGFQLQFIATMLMVVAFSGLFFDVITTCLGTADIVGKSIKNESVIVVSALAFTSLVFLFTMGSPIAIQLIRPNKLKKIIIIIMASIAAVYDISTSLNGWIFLLNVDTIISRVGAIAVFLAIASFLCQFIIVELYLDGRKKQ